MVRTTRRDFLFMTGAGAAAMWLAGCSKDSSSTATLEPPKAEIDGDLAYYAPTGYVPDDVIAGFEKEYGVKVNQTYFSTVDEMIQKLGAGAAYDITFMPSNFFARATGANLLLPIDHAVMSNWSEVTDLFQDPPFEPKAEHLAGPYAMGGIGLAYRKSRVEGLTGSWNDLWTLAPRLDRRAFIFDDVTVSMTMALARLGLPTDTSDPGQLNQAADSLIELRRSLGGFGSSAGEKLANGEADLLMNYTGATFSTLKEASFADDIDFQFCRETLAFNSDCLAIPAAAKHPGTGLMFADYLLRPDNMAKIVDFVGYPIATNAGMAAYDNLVAQYPFLTYDQTVLSNPDVWLASLQDQQLTAWNQAWTRVKASA
ncbi:spermidine/putrescine ABC transporter substrate-binding protein [Mycolicibacterium parafortuitum]|uniref:Spermidine/putrescine ABC transporter substrate-binding protein n=1 Tax=Mycolicibacterium parafortuitum TaxID=39692 RepID=A0A7I7TYD9_MYCPF|nr:spermidine/putrescine ABC transporter substrate-binding protein [Mycolicibacterium parafortuitum]BBY73651.1 spermidine/putrescine ABC transporter substrate-binding protein [Mycolicibacterium parafortuitum]